MNKKALLSVLKWWGILILILLFNIFTCFIFLKAPTIIIVIYGTIIGVGFSSIIYHISDK